MENFELKNNEINRNVHSTSMGLFIHCLYIKLELEFEKSQGGFEGENHRSKRNILGRRTRTDYKLNPLMTSVLAFKPIVRHIGRRQVLPQPINPGRASGLHVRASGSEVHGASVFSW